MSYSFEVRAATKAAAKNLVVERMCQEVGRASSHSKDAVQACVAAHALIDLLPDSEHQDVLVRMNGSLSGNWDGGGNLTAVSGVAFGGYAGLVARE